VRLREDKSPDSVNDIRMSQLTARYWNPAFDNSRKPLAEAAEKPKSEIILRKVYKKETSYIMVQKFLAWKTNKEAAGFAAYACSYTSFSAGRAEPLSIDVRVSSSREQILALCNEMIAKNVKTGWTELG
jgi:hypothetical protein